MKSIKFYVDKILKTFLIILIISNIYNLVSKINIKRNSIIVEATVYDVIVNSEYVINKRSTKVRAKDYNIYVEYNVEGQNYKGILNNNDEFYEKGTKIDIYCYKKDHTKIINESGIYRNIPYIIWLFICFIIIKIVIFLMN